MSDDPIEPVPASPHTLQLSYAPPIRRSMRRFLIIPLGLVTTVVTLVVLRWLSVRRDIDVMGYYAFLFVPLGALIAGAAAGLGYLIGWGLSGRRIRRRLVAVVILLQLLAYFGDRYVTFAARGPLVDLRTGAPVGFWRYLHVVTTSMRWVNRHDGTDARLGGAGYVFLSLQVLAFVLGGTALPALIAWTGSSGGDYCDLCSRSRTSKSLATLPASAPYPDDLDDAAREAFEERSAAMMERAEARLAELDQSAADGDVTEFLRLLAENRRESKGAGKLPVRIQLEIRYCPGCNDGSLTQWVTIGGEAGSSTTVLPSIALTRDFVAGVLRGQKLATADDVA